MAIFGAIPDPPYVPVSKMTKHWDALTLFLRLPCARVSDLFMSIIHTAELAKIDVFGYLVALQSRRSELGQYEPWMALFASQAMFDFFQVLP